MNHRLSVIITNYNHGRYLRDSVSQILNQTRTADELIIVDDASTDNSAAIIAELAREYPSIQAIYHEKNQGVNRAVNRGVAQSTGEYFTALGADDPLFTFFFENAMGLFAAHPQAGFCCGEYQSLFETSNGIEPRSWNIDLAPGARYFNPQEIGAVYRSRYQLSVPTAPAIWQRQAWERAGQLQPKLGWLADWFTALVVISRQGMCYIPEISQSIRVDPRSHQRAGQADLDGCRKLIGAILAELETPRFADARGFFQIPAVLARFGFKILHFLVHQPAYARYLSAELIRNAVQMEGLAFDWDITPLRGATPAQLVHVARVVLNSYAKTLRERMRTFAREGNYAAAQADGLKTLSAMPHDAGLRRELTALETEIARQHEAKLISAA
jgi:glycosyltransferase involved in cell wall biosynthesis